MNKISNFLPGEGALATRLSRAPAPVNDRVAEEIAALAAARLGLAGDPMSLVREDARVALAAGAGGGAPFLARLLRREADWLGRAWEISPEETFSVLVQEAERAGDETGDQAAFGARLRVLRRRSALLIALADLGGVWGLDEVTAALTLFAETALQAVVSRLLREEAATGAMPSLDPERSGLFALAMGKMGAHELNYSSDIDVILLFDETRLGADDRGRARERFPRLSRDLVRLMSRIDAEGYVARVDLRLRPDPASTSPVMSTASALQYYQTHGRAWERAAHVKARPAAGDMEAGAQYLETLSPFVWRRRVDFAAIEDAAEMLAKIRAHEGGEAVAFAGQDVKLGAGGIREIEFLAQTYQLILGGRETSLRTPRTRDALAALARAGRLAPDTAAALDSAYVGLRNLEHRIQMVEDQQTHRVPESAEGLARLAGLAGESADADGAASLEKATLASMRAVRAAAAPSLDQQPAQPAATNSQPGAVDAELRAAAEALPEPERALQVAEGWFEKDYRALRHPRAKARLRRLAPELLERMGEAADPMRALTRFDQFIAGLPAGVRVLSLLEAEDAVLRLVTEICATAPRLSQVLARRSQLLDAAFDQGFFAAPPPLEARRAEIEAALARDGGDYERVLDTARRWAAERRFQISVGLLQGRLATEEAGARYSDVAEAAVAAIWPHVLDRHQERFGAPPGRGATVLALGRLGSREMTSGSDLDLIVVYDAEPNETSEGAKPTPAPQYYSRLTQTLSLALSAPTSEGPLYEVDMRLRPSGRAGPLATSLSSFRRYQREEAWTWEHMALTRARPIAGAPEVGEQAIAAALEAMARPRGAEEIREDALNMRRRLEEANPRETQDPWSFKLTRGGLVDLEYLIQIGLLIDGVRVLGCGVAAGLTHLSDTGAFTVAEASRLSRAHRQMAALLSLTRTAVDGAFKPEEAGAALLQLLTKACGAADFDALELSLRESQAQVRAVFENRIGRL